MVTNNLVATLKGQTEFLSMEHAKFLNNGQVEDTKKTITLQQEKYVKTEKQTTEFCEPIIHKLDHGIHPTKENHDHASLGSGGDNHTVAK